jgi:hypothetical protein
VLLRVAANDPDAQRDLQAFRDGLQSLGWSAGKTILIEYRYASADPAQMDNYAAELVGLPAEVILAGGSLAVAALRKASLYELQTRSPKSSSQASRVQVAM